MNYSLDAQAAKEADSIGGRITETGKYIGRITKAKSITSQKGTKGIEIAFTADNKQTADMLTMWTVNQDGKEIFGYKQLMALMACLKVRDIATDRREIEEYDFDAKQRVKRMADIYPALMDKPVGILLQLAEYEKSDKSIGERMEIAGFFDAETELMASEILDRKVTPEQLAKVVAGLKPLKELRKSGDSSSAPSFGSSTPKRTLNRAPNLSDMDDDIPF